ncbi:SNUPN family protein [Megaselia abdita]
MSDDHRKLLQGIDFEESQEKRRTELLKIQKHQRATAQDSLRFQIDIEKIESTEYRNFKKTYKQKYGIEYFLQQAEWFKHRPQDLDDWFVVPYPKGMRCLVIACGGRTEVYSRKGHLITYFKSCLPGGGLNVYSKNRLTILDCVQIEKNKRYQVLDALVSGCQEFLTCEASFRFYWTKSRIEEWEENGNFKVRFEAPNFFDMAKEVDFTHCFQKYPFFSEDTELDAFMFYHKESSYTCGTTPLVGWLYPFMVEEILGFQVNEGYEASKPEAYEDARSYMAIFDEALKEKRKAKSRRRKTDVEMEELDETVELEMEEVEGEEQMQ